MKSDVFNTELLKFENDDIRESTIIILNKLPDYFYKVPASSTGKYHPLCDAGEGGLVRHTKVVLRICEEYFRNECFNPFDSRKRDLIRMALILHDGLKNGVVEQIYTVTEHPLLIANFILENAHLLLISDDEAKTVARLLSSHMGPWITDREGNKVLPKPKEYDELFVHNCDYIASRSFLNIEFDGNELINNPKILQKK